MNERNVDEQPMISAGSNVNFSDIENSPFAIGSNINQEVNVFAPKTAIILNFPNDEITYCSKDTVLKEIDEWIKTAKHLLDVNKDFDEALRVYKIAEDKLSDHKNEKFSVKVIVGKAVCYHYKGNVSKACSLLRCAEKINPEHPQILANISSYLRSYGDIEEAENCANKSLKYDQHCVLAKTVLALITYSKGNLDKSLKLLKEARNIDEKDAYPLYSMSYIYLREKKYDEAIIYGEKAVALANNVAPYYIHLGVLFLSSASPHNVIFTDAEFHDVIKRDYVQRSIQCFEKAIHLNSLQNNKHLNCDIYPNLATAFLLNREFEKSIEYFEKAIDNGVEEDEIYINLGMAYIALGKYEKSIEYYQPLIDKGIDSFVVRANLAIAYSIQNRFKDAEILLNKLIEDFPQHLQLYTNLSHIMYKKKEFQQGIEKLNEASQHLTLDCDAHYVLGKLYYKIEDYELAVKHFKKSIEINNEAIYSIRELIGLYVKCQMDKYALKYAEKLIALNYDNKSTDYHNIAVIYHNIGNNLKAIEYEKKALELDYRNVTVYKLLCICLMQECLIEDARTYFNEGLTVNPNDLELKHDYGIFLFQIGNLNEAVTLLNSLIEASNYIPAYISLANIYFLSGDYEKAIEYATEATLNETENEQAHFMLGKALSNAGKSDDAQKEFTIVQKINPKSKLVKILPTEVSDLSSDIQSDELQDIVNKYENASITLSKAVETANVSISDMLMYLNNKKVCMSLNLSSAYMEKNEKVNIIKKSAVVDIAILEILVRVGELDLLNQFFDHIYVTKEFECKTFNSMYKADNPYREIRLKLSIFKNGWIKGLIPIKDNVLFLSKILPNEIFSRKEIEGICLAIETGSIYLTEDILTRQKMKELNVPTCGLFGFLNSAIRRKIITKETGIYLYEKLIEKEFVSSFYDLE